MLFDYNAVRIAAIGDAYKVHVWRIIGEGHVWAELLESDPGTRGSHRWSCTMQPT